MPSLIMQLFHSHPRLHVHLTVTFTRMATCSIFTAAVESHTFTVLKTIVPVTCTYITVTTVATVAAITAITAITVAAITVTAPYVSHMFLATSIKTI